MITCKKATELLSKEMEEKLSFQEMLSLRFHLFICEFCAQFGKQIKLIRDLLRGSLGEQNEEEIKLSPEAKERLIEKISEEVK